MVAEVEARFSTNERSVENKKVGRSMARIFAFAKLMRRNAKGRNGEDPDILMARGLAQIASVLFPRNVSFGPGAEVNEDIDRAPMEFMSCLYDFALMAETWNPRNLHNNTKEFLEASGLINRCERG